MTPDDEHAYTREPDLLTPHYREAHISVAFTWDVQRVPALVAAWERHADRVTVGGPAIQAIERLKAAGFSRKKIRCYVLIGKDMAEERHRMIELYRAGALPFAQLFRDPANTITYTKEWRAFHKEWCRPAATYTIMKAYSNQQPKEQCNEEENHPAF